jgi:hypothetical protein
MNKWLLVLADGQCMLIDPLTDAEMKSIGMKLALKNMKFILFRFEDGEYQRLLFGLLEPQTPGTVDILSDSTTKKSGLVSGWLPVVHYPPSHSFGNILTLIELVELGRSFREESK